MGIRPNTMLHYTLKPLSLSEHLFSIQLSFTAQHESALTIALPAWIPGSYMIRDFAKNIVQITSNNPAHKLDPIDKQRWHLSHKEGLALGEVTLNYTVFAYDFSVRSAYINDEYAFCNGTSVFLSVEEYAEQEHQVLIDKSEVMPWAEIFTAMPCIDDSHSCDDQRRFSAENYLQLIDHPILIAKATSASFEQDNTRFHVIFTGQHEFDMQRICDDLKPICQHHIALFQEMPVNDYYFITLVTKNGFGGLEHSASTILQYSRDGIPLLGDSKQKDEPYRDFLALCSHELFHTWHVKRNRPEVFIEPDLSQEVYTPQLWIYEGITSFYDDVSLARTKLITPEQYAQILGANITRLLRNPGRQYQSIAQSSFYAWNKFYKQTPSSSNHIVSYYLKGGLVALGLDIRIRQLSDNQYSLDDVMRLLYRHYGAKNIGTPDDVISQICKQYLHIDIDSYLDIGVFSTMDLPLPQMLESIGLTLQLRPRSANEDKGGKLAQHAWKRDFGATLSDQSIGTKVVQIISASAAAEAGLHLDDIIISVNHIETNSKHLLKTINRLDLGSQAQLHCLRDGRLIRLAMPVKDAVNDTCYIEISDPTLFTHWLGLTED